MGGALGDAFIAKYNSSGSPLWARAIGGGGSDDATSIKINSLGTIFIAGYYIGDSIILGSTTLKNTNFFLVGYDSVGSIINVITHDTGNALIYATAIDASDNIICTGGFNGTICLFGNDTLNNTGYSNIYNVFVAKYGLGSSVNVPTSITTKEAITLYPNPNNGQMNISCGDKLFYELTIYDNIGRIVLKKSCTPGEQTLQVNISDYPDGIYFLRLKGEASSINTSFVLKK